MATLWAISDLHTGHTGNKPVTESLHPASPDDWLIVAGDVAERTDEIRWALDLLRKRFAKVIWVPGNHELWTTSKDPMQVFGRARYDYLVNMCDETRGGHPRASVPGVDRRRAARPPSCRCSCSTTTRSCPRARRRRPRVWPSPGSDNVVATDEFVLSNEPYATKDAWCRDRLARSPASGSRTSTG